MVRMILALIIGIALSGNSAFGQVSVTVLPPASVGACQQNNFGLVIDNSGGADTLKISSTLSSIGNATCAISSQGVDFRTTGTVPSGLNVLKQGDSLIVIFSNNFNDTLFYNAFIDCHIIPDSSSTVQIDLTQQFSADSITVTNGTSNSFLSPNLRYPYIREINPTANMDAWYLTDSVFTFYYQNTKNTSASILFTFQYDTSEYCHQIETDFVTYKIGVNGSSASYVGPTPVTLNFLDTLFVQQHVSMDTCLTTCPKDTAIFSWTCNYNQATLSSFCEACQDEYLHVYDVENEDNLSVDFIRIVPSDPIYDFTCMNDTAGVWWEYQIVNDGVGAIDTLQFYLTQDASIAGSINFLSLLPISSISINRNSGYLDTLVTPKSQWLCTNLVSDALYSMKVVATDFTENDTIFLRFKTIRCSEELDTLLDKPKFYNQWSMDSIYLVSICGSQKVLGQTGDLLSSENNIAGQGVGSNYDVDLLTSFYPTVSDLTFDTTYGGQNAWFDIGLHSALSTKQHVYQLLGCNGTNTSCDALYGWLRAQIQTDPNLHLLAPSLDAFLQKVDLVSGDTTFIVADWWYSAFDSTDCTNHTYNYYFNLNQPLMRNFLDSGSFVFNLTACCATDTSPTPYAVAFYLLADPLHSCFTVTIPTSHYSPLIVNDPTQQWLPLSDEGSGISVHCPGCLAPGIIVDYYKMQRNSFGLQDSDNDGRADSLNAVIDPSGNWFAANKNKLNTNFSGFGDRVEDLLTAHLQAGDPGSGGYSYVQMQQPPLNLRFNALQVGREIPMALDTMRLLPDSLFFYVDSPTNTPGGCFECEMYGMDVDSFTTQLKIVATGADIFNHFLDTITASNLYLFSFVDTVGGNLNSGTFDDTIPLGNSFNGFFEGQYYRLRVTYNVCGNFTGGNGTDVEDFVKKTDILNRMWVSGKVQSSSSIPQMYNDIASLHDSLSIGVDTSDIALGYSLMDTSYVNNYLFYCETRGSIHYFMSNDVVNGSSIVNTPGCKKDMQVYATSKIAGGKSMFDAYPYEYRPPALGLVSTNLIVPTDYYVSKASSRNIINFNNLNQDTDSVGIPLSDTTGNIFIDGSTLPLLQCLTQTINPNKGQTPHAGDQLNIRVIDLELLPLICDPSTAMPPDSSIVTHFDLQQYPCLTQASCSLPDSISLITATTAINMLTNNPQLTISTPNPVSTASEDTLCWDIKITNVSAAGVTQANFVYVAISDLTAMSFLNNWHFYPSGSTTAGFLDGTIVPLISALNPGVAISGELCAAISNCPPDDSLNFVIHYGWNCGNYPTSPYDSTAICEYSTFNLGVAIADTDLGSIFGKRYESPYTLCSTISLTTCFQSNEAGFVYPYQIVLDSIAPRLQIVSGSMSVGSQSAQLTPTAVDSVWTIHPDSIALLYPSGGFNLLSPELCFTFDVYLGCAYAGTTYLPNKTLFATTFCGDTIDSHIDYSPSGGFGWNDSTICDNCFTLDKFTVDSLAYTGTPFTYFIAACNYSSDTNTVSLVDLLPPGFTPSTPLPIVTTLQYMECDTFAVTGIFSQDGTCPDMMNTALLIHDNDTLLNDSVCVEVVDVCSNTQITITDSSYSHSYNSSYAGQSIFVAGLFYVDSTLTLNNCNVSVNAGGQITIVGPGQLILNGTTIQACDTMWRGITVSATTKLTVDSFSVIKDANIGIMAQPTSIVTIRSSDIVDCVLGIFTPPNPVLYAPALNITQTKIGLQASSLKPDYVLQPAHGSLPKAGIEVNNVIMTLGGSSSGLNEFFKLNTGIVANNSKLTVRRSKFYNITYDPFYTETYRGNSIVVVRTPNSDFAGSRLDVLPEPFAFNTIENCYKGIYTFGAAFQVNNIHILNVHTGVRAENASTLSINMINNCTITATNFGIYYIRNPWAKQLIATNNNITINGVNDPLSSAKPQRAAITMSETSLTPVKYTASGNQIAISNAQFSIYSGVLNSATIKFNIIDIKDSGTGINIQSNFRTSVSCNDIKSNYISGIAKNSIGISTGNFSLRTSIYCNEVDSTFRGFFFGGVNANTLFKGNDIRHHFNGLYLNNQAVIGQQPHHGNRWNNPNLSLGALNLASPAIVGASRFDVDSTLGSIYNPIVGPISGWFFTNPDTMNYTFYCSNSTVCDLPPHELIDTTLNNLIAVGEIESEQYAEETQAIAESYLYRELSVDSSLWMTDSTLIAFMIENQGEPVAYLYDAEAYLQAAYQYDTVFTSILDSVNNQIDIYTDSLRVLADLQAADPETDYSILIEQVNSVLDFLNQTIENLQIQREAMMTNNLQNAELNNNMVVNAELPENNTNILNDLEIHYLETGEDLNEIITNYALLLSIANQCPYAGGPAVERSRTFVALVNDSIFYDDENVCLQSGIYKIIGEDLNNQTSLNIHPNPASTLIDISLIGAIGGICKIEILDATGKNIMSTNMTCMEKNTRLDISRLTQGMYVVKVQLHEKSFLNQKFAIIR
ncbi:MAG: T9SS type A sorting domain-containing protein [Bacteroidetes bacterium]|nr:T9SS type A sorting domain-containing protein [Bacteroidota bacterium]